MATSRSSKKRRVFEAGATIFSGRPDPTWEVEEKRGAALLDIWNSLKRRAAEPTPQISLGYRGCYLRDWAGREWRAGRGVVTLCAPGGSESRIDPAGQFEQAVLRSAPAGKLP